MRNKLIFNALISSLIIFSCGKITETPTSENPTQPAIPTPNFITDSVSLENLNTVAPEGIIEEVLFFVGGMGGAGCFDDRFKVPTFFPEIPKSIELVPIEILRSIQVSLCGVEPGETIKFSIRHDESNTILVEEFALAQTISGQERGYVDFSSFVFTTDAQTGNYTVLAEGSGWSQEYTITVEAPHKAHVWLQNPELIFYGFHPNEIIKLLIYTDEGNLGHWKFKGWNQVQMDQYGGLKLRINIISTPYVGYLAFRSNNETVPSEIPGGGSDFSWSTYYCEGAPHQKDIVPGGYAVITSNYSSDIEFNSDNHLAVGQIVYIQGGPSCINNKLYWMAVCQDVSCLDTVPEGDAEGFYLEPIDPLSLTQSNQPQPIRSNNETNSIDNAQVIHIPAGTYIAGITSHQYSELADQGASKDLLDSSQPSHEVTLDDYKIYKTEVSNGMYSNCVDANICKAPLNYSSETHANYYNNPDYSDYPVVFVTWYMSQTYCQWAGGRLPTEAEWEYAARGPQEFLFPWGDNMPNSELANIGTLYPDTTPVDSFTLGESPFGLLNMVGNVWEWVQDWYKADYYSSNSIWINPSGPDFGDDLNGQLKAGKGGSYWISIGNSSPGLRDWYQADLAGSAVGFRCVIDE